MNIHVVQVNYARDPALTDPDELLDQYTTLTGWAEALLTGGASQSTVVQRFSHDAERERRGVRYLFRADGPRATPASWSRARPIAAAAAALDPDVLHVNGLGFPAQTRWLRRAVPGSVLVVQDHANGFHQDQVRRAIFRLGLGAADGVMFSAVELARPWREAGLIGARQPIVEVMESATRLRPIPRDQARRQTGVAGNPALLWVGRLDANKDPLTVLDGVARVVTVLPETELTMIYHATELLGAVRARLDTIPELRRRVHLVGRVPHAAMAAYCSAADWFVLGSHRAGSGYAALEAASCGAIPVVTDIPTFRRITDRGRAGFLWPVGQVAGLTAALRRASAADGAAVRAALRDHVEESLTWTAIGRHAVAAYRRLMEVAA